MHTASPVGPNRSLFLNDIRSAVRRREGMLFLIVDSYRLPKPVGFGNLVDAIVDDLSDAVDWPLMADSISSANAV